ncbi:hypothetical protein Pan216_36960 [Planctomycetes bacterium Pan216]|uniref:Uncharacterized protein n=1 Tax=Kolteria novifilia TaxID=2527975 RepID=A0A518B770_9BACT|nr:hypothetical protein Pan216_36960 [Planctomycetes bacterium Pan216]
MGINLIVVAVTLMLVGFSLVWLLSPRLRRWMESPKYQVLSWDRPARRERTRQSEDDEQPSTTDRSS